MNAWPVGNSIEGTRLDQEDDCWFYTFSQASLYSSSNNNTIVIHNESGLFWKHWLYQFKPLVPTRTKPKTIQKYMTIRIESQNQFFSFLRLCCLLFPCSIAFYELAERQSRSAILIGTLSSQIWFLHFHLYILTSHMCSTSPTNWLDLQMSRIPCCFNEQRKFMLRSNHTQKYSQSLSIISLQNPAVIKLPLNFYTL